VHSGDLKGKISPLLYMVGIATAWLSLPWLAIIFFAGTAAMWLIPDRRIERSLLESSNSVG
jgi:Zn-dependent membrane protease YugP